jgi:cell wall assembly regulator SMI1
MLTPKVPDSSFDSPQRSGRHVPLTDGRNSILTGVATASDSRGDITSPYMDDNGRVSPPNGDGIHVSTGQLPYTPTSPTNGAYSPGLRSVAARNASQTDGFDVQSPGDVPMQAFDAGLPPAPPVSHSWKRIDNWAEENYPELFDQVCEGATVNDLNELEHQLDCSLPQDVRDSLMIHDGQERGGMPTGIIFGAMLMDCEEIVQEWETWRRVNQQYLLDNPVIKTTIPSKTFSGSSEASSSKQRPSSRSSNRSNPEEWRQDLIQRQGCVPPNSVQKAYAHAGWIPLVRDWGGNNLAVDLAPGPGGKWGQIILFGRDYDTKYVVARSWSAFLSIVADDLNSGKWFVDEDTNELKLREFKDARVEPAYFNILRWRMDQKYGRRAAQRRSMAPPGKSGSKNASPLGSRSSSPYASPIEPNGDARGRSMQRLRGTSPLTSPMRTGYGKPPPLSRVTEEAAIPELSSAIIEPTKLVEVETPRESEDSKFARASTLARSESDLIKLNKENESPKAAGKRPEVSDDTMRDIEI